MERLFKAANLRQHLSKNRTNRSFEYSLLVISWGCSKVIATVTVSIKAVLTVLYTKLQTKNSS